MPPLPKREPDFFEALAKGVSESFLPLLHLKQQREAGEASSAFAREKFKAQQEQNRINNALAIGKMLQSSGDPAAASKFLQDAGITTGSNFAQALLTGQAEKTKKAEEEFEAPIQGQAPSQAPAQPKLSAKQTRIPIAAKPSPRVDTQRSGEVVSPPRFLLREQLGSIPDFAEAAQPKRTPIDIPQVPTAPEFPEQKFETGFSEQALFNQKNFADLQSELLQKPVEGEKTRTTPSGVKITKKFSTAKSKDNTILSLRRLIAKSLDLKVNQVGVKEMREFYKNSGHPVPDILDEEFKQLEETEKAEIEKETKSSEKSIFREGARILKNAKRNGIEMTSEESIKQATLNAAEAGKPIPESLQKELLETVKVDEFKSLSTESARLFATSKGIPLNFTEMLPEDAADVLNFVKDKSDVNVEAKVGLIARASGFEEEDFENLRNGKFHLITPEKVLKYTQLLSAVDPLKQAIAALIGTPQQIPSSPEANTPDLEEKKRRLKELLNKEAGQ